MLLLAAFSRICCLYQVASENHKVNAQVTIARLNMEQPFQLSLNKNFFEINFVVCFVIQNHIDSSLFVGKFMCLSTNTI